MTKETILIDGCNTETLFDSCSRFTSNFLPGTMFASSTVPTLPSPLTGATSKLLNVVVVHVFGRGVVVVLGPFLESITSSQFHLGCCGNETAIETITRKTKNRFALTSIVSSSLDLFCSHICQSRNKLGICLTSHIDRSPDRNASFTLDETATRKVLEIFSFTNIN